MTPLDTRPGGAMSEASRKVPVGVSLDGRWVNPDGSVLELEVHQDGRVTGSFILGSDRPSYRPYRVTGTYLARPEGGRGVVGSVLGWPKASAVTVWTGEFDSERSELRTSWLLAVGPHVIDQPVPSVGGVVFRRLVRPRSMARAG